jgi:predicted DNA-binding ribbon-helix-helix protein
MNYYSNTLKRPSGIDSSASMPDAIKQPIDVKSIIEAEIKTSLVSKNITIEQKRTSIRLEPEMWQALKEISRREQCSIHDVCTLVSKCKRDNSSLTASIRVFLMLYFKAASTEDGHVVAGHGKLGQLKQRLCGTATVQ